MKGKTLTLLVSLCAALLLLTVGSLRPTLNAAAQGDIPEEEPNDNKAQAQMLDLVPGGTVVVEGSVAPGDGGTLVAELRRPEFAEVRSDDPQEDWFEIEVNGALEFSIELSWTGSSDLDNWTFADISEDVFPDGLASHHVAATLTDNPEVEPNRIYYAYSDRRQEAGGQALTIPDTSPYFVTVSNVDGEMPLSTDYRLALISPAPGATRTVIHDTSGPGLFAPVFPSDLGGQLLLALQRVTPPEYPARLDRVDLTQFRLGGRSQVGDGLDLVVLVDPAGTGDPANATEVLRRRVRIQVLNTVNGFPVQDANIIVESGDIYAGFQVRESITDLHIPFDIDKVGFGRSFISTDEGESFGVLMSASLDVGIPFEANVGIDALLTINPAAAAQSAPGSQKVVLRKTNDRATRAIKSLSMVKLK